MRAAVSAAPANESAALRFFYHTAPGRLLLRPLICRPVSQLVGLFMRSPLSRPLIAPFARKNGIDLSDYVTDRYDSFHAFFIRQIRPELRPVDPDPAALIAPCDGYLTAWPIQGDTVLPVKQSRYTIPSLLGSDEAARPYAGGLCLVFRLCAEHYHHYCYLDDGVKGNNRFLPGRLHTVRPIALEQLPVFIQNCREYTRLDTAHFGPVTQVEVGALLVGRIHNLHGAGPIRRGQEKGMFYFGGSTIILLLEPGRARLDPALLAASARGEETLVRLGQRIGTAENKTNMA